MRPPTKQQKNDMIVGLAYSNCSHSSTPKLSNQHHITQRKQYQDNNKISNSLAGYYLCIHRDIIDDRGRINLTKERRNYDFLAVKVQICRSTNILWIVGCIFFQVKFFVRLFSPHLTRWLIRHRLGPYSMEKRVFVHSDAVNHVAEAWMSVFNGFNDCNVVQLTSPNCANRHQMPCKSDFCKTANGTFHQTQSWGWELFSAEYPEHILNRVSGTLTK